MSQRLRSVEEALVRMQRSARLPALLAMLNPVHARLAYEKRLLEQAMQSRREALDAQEREKDPAAFDIRALRAEAYTELAWINSGPALRVLSELTLDTPGKIVAGNTLLGR